MSKKKTYFTIPNEARDEWDGSELIKIAMGETRLDLTHLKEVKPGEYSFVKTEDVMVIPAESNEKTKEYNEEITYTAAMENISVDDTQK